MEDQNKTRAHIYCSTATCDMCGKQFIKFQEHAYKVNRGKLLFCSYSCYNKYLKEQHDKFMEEHKEDFRVRGMSEE